MSIDISFLQITFQNDSFLFFVSNFPQVMEIVIFATTLWKLRFDSLDLIMVIFRICSKLLNQPCKCVYSHWQFKLVMMAMMAMMAMMVYRTQTECHQMSSFCTLCTWLIKAYSIYFVRNYWITFSWHKVFRFCEKHIEHLYPLVLVHIQILNFDQVTYKISGRMQATYLQRHQVGGGGSQSFFI